MPFHICQNGKALKIRQKLVGCEETSTLVYISGGNTNWFNPLVRNWALSNPTTFILTS